ncbi:MAG: SIS domain-containing protein [Kiritimatiellae bacterium]|nr:SIS domain-containing protein [Kiritimatiellia bacterium]MDD5521325.1 SIS domain-containing protein [Kiritimatiellia bacterium]
MVNPLDYLRSVCEAAGRVDLVAVTKAIDLLEEAYHSGKGVFVIGNGGSASNASHFAQDISKGSIPDLSGKRFRVMSLTDNTPFITAIANDIGYERVFDIQLSQFAREGDILVAISGSGNSPNILKAVERARELKMNIISVTGFNGGKLIKMSDIQVHVPCNDMCKSEAVHGIIFHMITDILKARLLSS